MPDLNYEELNSEYMQSDLLVATTQLFEHTFKPKIGSTLVITFLSKQYSRPSKAYIY